MCDVLAALIAQHISSNRNVTHERWVHEAAYAPTWLKAHTLSGEMFDIGIDPVPQNMQALVHLLMATPGPTYGAHVCSVFTESQVRDALFNR